jgi:hypothetical protein
MPHHEGEDHDRAGKAHSEIRALVDAGEIDQDEAGIWIAEIRSR